MEKIRNFLFILLLSFIWGPVWLILLSIIQMIILDEFIIPSLLPAIISALGAIFFILKIPQKKRGRKTFLLSGFLIISLLLLFSKFHPFAFSLTFHPFMQITILVVYGFALAFSLNAILAKVDFSNLSRYYLEVIMIRALKGVGFIFFITIVALPFFIMVITSLKSQQLLLLNPLDFSLDFSKGIMPLLRSYLELLDQFNFGSFLLNSFLVSSITVIISLFFSIPGAYAIARLKFPGREFFFHILLIIYMVPAIILVIPLYAVFTQLSLRDSFWGLLIVYPATTIPVALYMLQGYFRSIPYELEEAGIIDGLTRLGVIIKITIPLSLPALVSVALYVFMIAWNEFLFAFMFLDSTEIFTLSRGLVSLNSSEVPRQFLMAGAVLATIPVLVIFLILERFLVSGLTAGSVKG